jgi:hypothetical protein
VYQDGKLYMFANGTFRRGPPDPEPPRLVPEHVASRPQLAARVRGLERAPRAGDRLVEQAADLQRRVKGQAH